MPPRLVAGVAIEPRERRVNVVLRGELRGLLQRIEGRGDRLALACAQLEIDRRFRRLFGEATSRRVQLRERRRSQLAHERRGVFRFPQRVARSTTDGHKQLAALLRLFGVDREVQRLNFFLRLRGDDCRIEPPPRDAGAGEFGRHLFAASLLEEIDGD